MRRPPQVPKDFMFCCANASSSGSLTFPVTFYPFCQEIRLLQRLYHISLNLLTGSLIPFFEQTDTPLQVLVIDALINRTGI